MAIAFRAMKPLQNHFTVPVGALLGKLCLDWVRLSMPGFKVYALSPERQKITEKNEGGKMCIKIRMQMLRIKIPQSIYQFSDPIRRQEQADECKDH